MSSNSTSKVKKHEDYDKDIKIEPRRQLLIGLMVIKTLISSEQSHERQHLLLKARQRSPFAFRLIYE